MRSVSPVNSGPSSPSRGRLFTAAEIRKNILGGAVSEWWIRRHVAPQAKITLGRSTVVWYEHDVYTWIEERKGS